MGSSGHEAQILGSFTVDRLGAAQGRTAPSTGRWTSPSLTRAARRGRAAVTGRRYPRSDVARSRAVRRPGHVALRDPARLGLERRLGGIGGVAVRRLRPQPLDGPGRCRRAMARLADLVRRARAADARAARAAAADRCRAVLLDPFGAAVWLSDTPRGESLSPSLAWFAALTRFAVQRRRQRTGHAGGARRGTVHRRPLAAGADRRAPRRARPRRRRRPGDLPQRLERDDRRDRRRRWSTGWRGRCCTTAAGSPTSVASGRPTCRRSAPCSRRSPSPTRSCDRATTSSTTR